MLWPWWTAAAVLHVLLNFVLGSLVLWLVSKATMSSHSTFRTSVEYHLVMTVLMGIGFAMGLGTIAGLSAGGIGLKLWILFTLGVSFAALKYLYETGPMVTAGLTALMWLVRKGAEILAEKLH